MLGGCRIGGSSDVKSKGAEAAGRTADWEWEGAGNDAGADADDLGIGLGGDGKGTGCCWVGLRDVDAVGEEDATGAWLGDAETE